MSEELKDVKTFEDCSKEELLKEHTELIGWLGKNHRAVFDEYFEVQK